MRKIHFTAVLLLCTILSYAQTTQWIGSEGGAWSSESNWSNGLPQEGNNALITSGSDIVINDPLIIDFSVTIYSGDITINADVFNNGNIINSNGNIVLETGAKFVNSSSVRFTNDGPFTNRGTFQNYGTLAQNGNGIFTNIGVGIFSNYGNISNANNFINNGKIENFGSFSNGATFTNNALTENSGQFINSFVSTFNNNSDATFTNNASAQLYIDKDFNNEGVFDDNGSTTVNAAGVVTNNGTMNLNGTFELSTTFENHETVNIGGSYKSNFGKTVNRGQWNNTSTTENVGTFTNAFAGTLTNTGTLINASCAIFIQNARNTIQDVTNDGVFYTVRGSVVETEASQGRVLNSNTRIEPTPTLNCSDIRIQTDSNGEAVISDGDVLIEGDAKYCNLVSIDLSKTEFTCSDLGPNPVTLTMTDGFGNSSTCDVTVTVVERSPNPCNTSTLNYCDASVDNTNSTEYIRYVSIGDTRQSSYKDGGYRDYTNKEFIIEFGEFYDLSVVRWGGRITNRVGVWIDWNNDGDFTDEGEAIVDDITARTNPATINGQINIPGTAVPGRTRMRVAMSRDVDGPFGPCESYEHGEIEDFTVKIVSEIVIQACGESVEIDAAPGATSQTTGWIPPKGFSTCANGIEIEQIEGLTNGSAFPIGTTVNTFRFKDGCENESTCSFTVKVNSTPVTFSFECPENQTVLANEDLGGALLNWVAPFPSTTCPAGVSLPVQTSGPQQGDFLATGLEKIITYEVADNCDNRGVCSFTISVADSESETQNYISTHNLALEKPATQSTTAFSGQAERAVDGNTDGTYSNKSVTHTTNSNTPWWSVDLGEEYTIDKINIFNRTNCCTSRLVNAKIYVGTTNSNNPNDYTEVGILADNIIQSFDGVNTVGRYVMVRIEGKGILSLAEVQVFGLIASKCETSFLLPAKIEAEDYCDQSGVRAEATGDVGGGENIGFVGTGDWMEYSVTVINAGPYEVNYRVAARNNFNGTIQLQIDGDNLGSIDVPSTGRWQKYTTISHLVDLPAGTHIIKIFAEKQGWNLNWFEFNSALTSIDNPVNIPTIFATDAIATTPCDNITYGEGTITLDGGSGYQVFDKTWAEIYNCASECGNSPTLDNLSAGDYNVLIKDENGETICNQTITLSSGNFDTAGEEDNTRGKMSGNAAPLSSVTPRSKEQISVFPNPAKEELFLNMNPYAGKKANIFLFDHLGKVVLEKKAETLTSDVVRMDINQLHNGMYYLVVEVNKEVAYSKKVIVHRGN